MAMGEFELIARLSPYLTGDRPGVPVGHGDDAAVLVWDGDAVCVAVDALVEGRHFRRDLSGLADLGWKAVAVNCSDLAAMGAAPRAAVVALCRPGSLPPGEVEELYAGLREAAERWDLHLVGGDTVAADQLIVSVTVLGAVRPDRVVRRSGARPGDALVVVGELGPAAAALAQIEEGLTPTPALLEAHRRPAALTRAGQALAEAGATAMIDVSDGLGADLEHLCTASGVGAVVEAHRLPIPASVRMACDGLGRDPMALACGGGEDFALLAALPPDEAAETAARAGELEGMPGRVIGKIVAVPDEGPAAILRLPDGSRLDLTGMGYDHYRRDQTS